jgi:hypothetical protein
VNDVQATAVPDVNDVLLKIRLDVAVPTDPSKTTVVASDCNALNQVAVPVAAAFPDVIAFAVKTPFDAVGENVALNRNVANNV